MASSSKKSAAVPPVVQPAEILTPEEVSQLLRTSLGWVYEKCRTRQRDPLPALHIGRYLRFEKHTVLEWARNHGNPAARKIAKAGAR
jgi:predicted DNA-binding transcriptional regulator AlpA